MKMIKRLILIMIISILTVSCGSYNKVASPNDSDLLERYYETDDINDQRILNRLEYHPYNYDFMFMMYERYPNYFYSTYVDRYGNERYFYNHPYYSRFYNDFYRIYPSQIYYKNTGGQYILPPVESNNTGRRESRSNTSESNNTTINRNTTTRSNRTTIQRSNRTPVPRTTRQTTRSSQNTRTTMPRTTRSSGNTTRSSGNSSRSSSRGRGN